ncbi:hypothetical protein ACLB2K_024980 [Fragaria x ananassa]
MIRHHFHSEVWQPEILPGVSIPSCSDLFSIKFQLFEVTRSCCRTEQEGENVTSEDLEESKLVAERQTKPLSRVQLLCLRTRDTWLICTGALSSMGVPQHEQPAIVEKIVEALRVAVPFRPICVVIEDIVTVQECNGGEESSNQKRFDNLEAKKEGEEEEEECVVCLEDISDFGPKSVTPCSHIYHSDCIWKWQKETQKKGHLFSCPVCRCHIAEMAGEPSQPLPLPALSLQPPPYQIINEEEDDVETDPRPEPSWCEVGCTLTTLLRIRFCFLSSCF